MLPFQFLISFILLNDFLPTLVIIFEANTPSPMITFQQRIGFRREVRVFVLPFFEIIVIAMSIGILTLISRYALDDDRNDHDSNRVASDGDRSDHDGRRKRSSATGHNCDSCDLSTR